MFKENLHVFMAKLWAMVRFLGCGGEHQGDEDPGERERKCAEGLGYNLEHLYMEV